MMIRPHLWLEPLEHRRLLSSEGLESAASADAEFFGAQPGREPIYPPLAPAMWMDEWVGSFELPEEITIAFFEPDEPAAREPVEDAEQHVPPGPPILTRATGAGSASDDTARIASLLFQDDQRLDMSLELDPTPE